MKKRLLTLIFLLLSVVLYAYSAKSTHHQEHPLSTKNLLALSWQNAFCQTHQNKRECRRVKPTDFSASHFTLHGLWPQPRSKTYCQKSEKVWLNKALYHELLEVMPAAKSGLHQHEWKKHGTCYGASQENYFKDSIRLLKELNHSKVRDLFVRNVGKTLTLKQVRRAFDNSFGQGSGRKVKMLCHKGLITELQLNLEGEISKTTPLSTLMKHAKTIHGSCQKGRVDRVGF